MRVANLFACATALAAAGAGALTDSDILRRLEALEAKNAEMKAEFTEVTAKNADLTRKYADITAKYTEIQATLDATSTGELKMVNADECPPGWVEFNKTQGYLLTGRPKGGETGATINRPLGVGEKGRTPEHSHEVAVQDLGHAHVTVVNDPGHSHHYDGHSQVIHGGPQQVLSTPGGEYRFPGTKDASTRNKTGIIVDTLPAKSNIEVSLTANEDGEGYPLVYVLVCQRQRVLGNSTSQHLPPALFADT
jgi:hypothetical protein